MSNLPMLFGSFRPPKPENTIFRQYALAPFLQKTPRCTAAEVDKKTNFFCPFYEISRLPWRRTFCISHAPKEVIQHEAPPSNEEGSSADPTLRKKKAKDGAPGDL
jgi:hypothetical protein